MSTTWRNTFSSSTDLDVFKYLDTNYNANVTIENGAMKLLSTVTDAYKTPIIQASDIGIKDIVSVSFLAKHSSIGSSGCFPNITLCYEDGNWLRLYIYNNFSWSGYPEHLWQQLYANRGYGVAYTSTQAVTRLWSNPSNSGMIDNYFNLTITKSQNGNIVVNAPTTTTNYTITPPSTFATKKIIKLEFGLVRHWFNSGVVGYIDDLTLVGGGNGGSWSNVGGVWKQSTQYVNVNGVWKQGTPYINVNGVWKQGQ